MMVKMMISQLASLRICANNDEVLIDIELPEDDPMTSFIKQRQEETEKRNAEFIVECRKEID